MVNLPRMSHSRYDDYAKCGEMYRLKRIEKVPYTPSIYAVAGTAFHEWTDRFDSGPPEWARSVDDRSTASTVGEAPFFDGRDEWYANRITELITQEEEKSGFAFKDWDNPAHKRDANETALAKFQTDVGPDMIRKYIDWRAQTAWQIAFMACAKCDGVSEINERPCRACSASGGAEGIEFGIEYTLQGVEEIVKIDRIFQIPETGQLVAIDTKTWNKRRVTAQLPTYLVALRQAGFNVGHAAYYEARKGEVTELKDYRHWDENRLAAMHVQAAHMISQGWFLPAPGEACQMCDVKRHCRWYLG